eukprot:jgi/Botrbrau1/9045/Bobra.0376s0021.1
MVGATQADYLTIPSDAIDLDNLHLGAARRLFRLREALDGTRSAGHLDRRPLLAGLGFLLLLCPPPTFRAPSLRSQGLSTPAAGRQLPLSAQEEALLCLLLVMEDLPTDSWLFLPVLWGLALLLGQAGCPRYLAHLLLAAHLPQRHQPAHCLLLCQALLGSGQAAKASLALESMEGGGEGAPDPLPLLLLVKAKLTEGGSAIADALRCARRAVAATGKGSELEAKAQQALGVALAAAGSTPGVTSSKERGALLIESVEALQEAARLDPGDPLTLYHLALLQAEARQLDEAEAGARASLQTSGGTLGPAWALLALVLSAQQRVAEALSVTQEGLREADPREHPQLLAIQARLLVALGRPDEGLVALTQLLAQLGEMGGKSHGDQLPSKQAARLAWVRGEAWGEVARCFLAKTAPGDALEAGDRYLQLCPWSP